VIADDLAIGIAPLAQVENRQIMMIDRMAHGAYPLLRYLPFDGGAYTLGAGAAAGRAGCGSSFPATPVTARLADYKGASLVQELTEDRR
jgi:hypothetical protein